MSTTVLHFRRQQRWIQVLMLSLVAVGLNLLRIDIVFGFDLLLGSSLAVFALLWLGDIGLLVGISTSLITWKAWGYPWCAFTTLMELLWLRAYLNHFSNNGSSHINGRIVLADILFWIAIGIPIVFLLFGITVNLNPSNVLLLAIKQALNGVINTTTGFSLYLAWRIWQSRRAPTQAVGIHGLTTATVMLTMIISGLTIATVASNQLIQASHQGELARLEMVAKSVAMATEDESRRMAEMLRDSGSMVEFERIWPGSEPQNYQSNSGLFKTLEQTYRPSKEAIIKARGLELLTASPPTQGLKQLINGYWKFDLAKANISMDGPINSATEQNNVIAVEPARELIQQIQQQSTKIMGMLAWSLLFAALVSEIIARVFSRQFSLPHLTSSPEADKTMSRPQSNGWQSLTTTETAALQPLQTGFILDLNHIIDLVNNRNEVISDLRDDLLSTKIRLRDSKEEINVLSTTDPLTGCYNRHELYRRLDFELQRCNRDSSELSCICFEVDHYNQIRDSYGQGMAEQVLINIVHDIQARARTTDCLCRSSGAEFSLILPMCSVKAAETLAQTFRRAVADKLIQFEDQQISVTLSIGISCLKAGNDDSESLINRAENALYRAKAEGRNRIVLT